MIGPTASDSLLHYRQYCRDNGRKPKRLYGLFDSSGRLKAWSTKRMDLISAKAASEGEVRRIAPDQTS